MYRRRRWIPNTSTRSAFVDIVVTLGLSLGSYLGDCVRLKWGLLQNRLKVFVHDGFGLWLCARRLQQGHFVRPSTHRGERFELSMSQLQAFAVGLPWERLDEHAKISIL